MGLCRSKFSRDTGCQNLRSKRNLPIGPVQTRFAKAGWLAEFFLPPTLTTCSSASLWLTETHSTSFEWYKPVLLNQTLFKSLAALLKYFVSIQSDLISSICCLPRVLIKMIYLLLSNWSLPHLVQFVHLGLLQEILHHTQWSINKMHLSIFHGLLPRTMVSSG